MDLSPEEVASATEVFSAFDVHQVGRVKMFELGKMLERVGIALSPQEVAACRESVDDEGTRQVRLAQFLTLIQRHKANRELSKSDMLGAFVACGGKEDGSGEVDNEAMSKIIEEFGLSVDLAMLKDSISMDQAENVSFDKFQKLVEQQKTTAAR